MGQKSGDNQKIKHLKSSSEVFQKKNSEAFSNINGVHVIAGDMIIAAVDEKKHTEMIHKVIKRAKEVNLKFNADNIQYKVTKVRYMGHIISAEGVQPDTMHQRMALCMFATTRTPVAIHLETDTE